MTNPLPTPSAQLEINPMAALFPPMSGPEYEELKESIKSHGLRHPIVLDDEGRIADGKNRYRACVELGIEPETVPFIMLEEPGTLFDFITRENLTRRNLTEDQRVTLATDLLEVWQAQARERQQEAGMKYGKGHPKPVTDSPPPNPQDGKTRHKIAEAAGVSDYKAGQAMAIKQEDPELHEQVKKGQTTLKDAHKRTRHAKAAGERLEQQLRNIYDQAKNRCTNPKNKDYPNYGGRGIKFKFDTFEQFIAAVGRRPSKQHSLHRKDNDGNYEAGNVVWAEGMEQASNRRQANLRRDWGTGGGAVVNRERDDDEAEDSDDPRESATTSKRITKANYFAEQFEELYEFAAVGDVEQAKLVAARIRAEVGRLELFAEQVAEERAATADGTFAQTSRGGYKPREKAGPLRASSGDAGGGSEVLLAFKEPKQ